jgi:phage terminase small subunit
MRGRKPSNLSVLSGSHPPGGRKRHFHHLEPLGAPPAHLTAEQKKVFEAVRDSAPRGLLGAIDAFVLEVLAVHVSIHRRAVNELSEFTVATKTTERVHPLTDIVSSQATIIVRLAECLCLTPATRARVKLPEPGAGWGDVTSA